MRFSLLATTAFLSLGATAAAQETVTYTYDALSRLVATSTSGGTNSGTTSSYSYDAASNRTNVTVSTSGGGMPTPTPSCSFAIADGSNNYESTVWMQVNRTGTCSGAVTLHFQMAENRSPYSANSYPSTGAISLATSDTYKLIPVSHYGSTGTVLVTISLASGSATITRATGSAQFYE